MVRRVAAVDAGVLFKLLQPRHLYIYIILPYEHVAAAQLFKLMYASPANRTTAHSLRYGLGAAPRTVAGVCQTLAAASPPFSVFSHSLFLSLPCACMRVHTCSRGLSASVPLLRTIVLC